MTEQLNLPKPPKGYFWRVEVQKRYTAYLELRRKRWLATSVLNRRTRIVAYTGLKAELEAAAHGALQDLAKDLKAQEIAGDYHD